MSDKIIIYKLREALQTYGEHRWKCAITRGIRTQERLTFVCDCGWDEVRKELLP